MNPIPITEINKNKDKLNKSSVDDPETISFTDEQLFNMKGFRNFSENRKEVLEDFDFEHKYLCFKNMSHKKLLNFYLILQDIWNYRSQINHEQKNKIVPNNDVLNICMV